jgi:hypothetical protein
MFSSPWAPYAPLLPFAIGREVERRAPILVLMIDDIASLKKLFHDGLMTNYGRDVERRVAILLLKFYITSTCNELFRDGTVPILGREV